MREDTVNIQREFNDDISLMTFGNKTHQIHAQRIGIRNNNFIQFILIDYFKDVLRGPQKIEAVNIGNPDD